MDFDVSFWLVIVYSIMFIVQLVINFVNFLRTGKWTKMVYDPSSLKEQKKDVSSSTVPIFTGITDSEKQEIESRLLSQRLGSFSSRMENISKEDALSMLAVFEKCLDDKEMQK